MDSHPDKILVVETNEDFRSSLCEFLQNLGYRITETNIAENAVGIALTEIPDLIFIDLLNEEALEVIFQIRQNKKLSRIPILTSSADGGFGIELFSNIEKFGSDFIGYLTKPINFSDLAEQIKLILAKKIKAA